MFEENTATIPQQWHQKCLLVFLNAYRNNTQAHGITVVAFHPEVFKVSYFHEERMCKSLLASSPKVTRRKIARVARFSRDRDPKLRQLCHYRLAWGTDNTWSAKRCRPTALSHIRTWGIMKDGHGYHHIPPTSQLEDTFVCVVSPG